MQELEEAVAEAIYDVMRKSDPEGTVYPWVPGGNSFKQEEARRRARNALSTIPKDGVDWTTDSEGRSNSSEQFKTLVKEVERLIRGDAHMLISGRADLTAGLIMAQLAHRHGLSTTPTPDIKQLMDAAHVLVNARSGPYAYADVPGRKRLDNALKVWEEYWQEEA